MSKMSDFVKFLNIRTLAPVKQKFDVRYVNRCKLCGRSRAYMRRFNMCRICFRENALKGNIPGVVKASW